MGFGPLVGMRDSLDSFTSQDPARALLVENCHPLELDKPSVFVGRPGFELMGAQGGAANKRTGQLVYQFTKLDGTEYTVRIVGGQGIQTYNWATDTWSTVVTVANLTTASITLSETARCYAVTFTDKMVISDGVNVPFTWDGTSGAGGLVELTNAPVLYGQPVVYYAKLFGIKNTERNVIVWSEEQDPTIGYETAPYSNSWQLAQTDQEAIYALSPSNERLYYLRARSIGAVSGAVTPEFSSDGTKEGVSETVGTNAPGGALYLNGRVFFPDPSARPHYASTQGVTEAYNDVRETIRGLDPEYQSQAQTVYDPMTGLVLFTVVEQGNTIPSAAIGYNPILNVPVGIWRGYTFHYLGLVKDGDGVPRLVHLSSDGYAYAHGVPDGTHWNDELAAATAPIRHTIAGPHLGTDTRNEKRFSRMDALIRADTDIDALSAYYVTPYLTSDALSAAVEGTGAVWDEFEWDEAVWAGGSAERHVPFGLSGMGRWMRPVVQHEALGERFAFQRLTVDYTDAGDLAVAP